MYKVKFLEAVFIGIGFAVGLTVINVVKYIGFTIITYFFLLN